MRRADQNGVDMEVALIWTGRMYKTTPGFERRNGMLQDDTELGMGSELIYEAFEIIIDDRI